MRPLNRSRCLKLKKRNKVRLLVLLTPTTSALVLMKRRAVVARRKQQLRHARTTGELASLTMIRVLVVMKLIENVKGATVKIEERIVATGANGATSAQVMKLATMMKILIRPTEMATQVAEETETAIDLLEEIVNGIQADLVATMAALKESEFLLSNSHSSLYVILKTTRMAASPDTKSVMLTTTIFISTLRRHNISSIANTEVSLGLLSATIQPRSTSKRLFLRSIASTKLHSFNPLLLTR